MVRGARIPEGRRGSRILLCNVLPVRGVGGGIRGPRRQPRQDVCAVRVWLRHPRDKDHPQRVHYPRLLGQVDVRRQVRLHHARRCCWT